MKKEYLTVGELARKVGVTVRTLQYYDREALLKPSAISVGGRRLYTAKDIVKLHQILAFKYLGFSLEEIKSRLFSLDTSEEVVSILNQQKKAVNEQIEELSEALMAIEKLQSEVMEMNTVDFKKYAEIIEMLRNGNKEYWVWKHLNKPLSEHIKDKYADNQEEALKVYDTYREVLDEACKLKTEKESPESERSISLAEKWWNMVMNFTGGDMSLVSELENFNADKVNWNNELAGKQKEVDEFLSKALESYFKKNVSSEETE